MAAFAALLALECIGPELAELGTDGALSAEELVELVFGECLFPQPAETDATPSPAASPSLPPSPPKTKSRSCAKTERGPSHRVAKKRRARRHRKLPARKQKAVEAQEKLVAETETGAHPPQC